MTVEENRGQVRVNEHVQLKVGVDRSTKRPRRLQRVTLAQMLDSRPSTLYRALFARGRCQGLPDILSKTMLQLERPIALNALTKISELSNRPDDSSRDPRTSRIGPKRCHVCAFLRSLKIIKHLRSSLSPVRQVAETQQIPTVIISGSKA